MVDGSSGGGNNDNGNGKGNKHNKQGQKEQNKPQYSTFKYSARLKGALHEAVMLGIEPFFLTYSEKGEIQNANYILKLYDGLDKLKEVPTIFRNQFPALSIYVSRNLS